MLNDPHESGARTSRFAKNSADERVIALMNDAIRGVDVSTEVAEEVPPLVFIVGVPRSGTTLLSQLISRFMDVGYVTNLMARFWSNPVLGIAVSRSVLGENPGTKIELRSVHGTTSGPWGPHEFGYFWREMLGLDNSRTHRLDHIERAAVDGQRLAGVLTRMAVEFGRPLVFKNPICGFQATLLEKLCPNSLFVCTERHEDQVVESVRTARIERYGSDTVWWSLKPSTFPDISGIESVEEQIRAQVRDCKSDFQQEFRGLTRAPLMIAYEQMRTSPLDVLLHVCQEVERMGGTASLTEDAGLLRVPADAGLY